MSDDLVLKLALMRRAADMQVELERDLMALKVAAGRLEIGTLAEKTVRTRIRNLHAFLEELRKECAA